MLTNAGRFIDRNPGILPVSLPSFRPSITIFCVLRFSENKFKQFAGRHNISLNKSGDSIKLCSHVDSYRIFMFTYIYRALCSFTGRKAI